MVTVVARLVSMMLLLLLMLLVCLVHSTPEKRETRETREWTSRKNPNECETNSESIHLPVGGMGGDRSSRLELARRANRTPTLVTGVLQGTNRWMDGWMEDGYHSFGTAHPDPPCCHGASVSTVLRFHHQPTPPTRFGMVRHGMVRYARLNG